jgi:hypothetical protein
MCIYRWIGKQTDRLGQMDLATPTEEEVRKRSTPNGEEEQCLTGASDKS